MNILPGEVTKLLILTFVIGVIITLILGPITIPLLRRLKFGQNIREEGPKSHLKKAGTPTMGGVMFILSTTIVMFIMSDSFTEKGMVALYSLIAFGFIGFLDDLLKILKKQSEGLKAWQKMLLLLIVSGAFGYYSYVNLSHDIVIPFTSFKLPLGVLYVPFVIFVYAAMTNAVNLTDGLDGLATSVTIVALAFIGYIANSLSFESSLMFVVIAISALIGFLFFNINPAKVFMGDTGSLGLGGLLVGLTTQMGLQIILVLVGIMYIVETLSVIIQVFWFKKTGKRVFKMSPIHHHYEMCGLSENKIVLLFTTITMIFGFIAILSI